VNSSFVSALVLHESKSRVTLAARLAGKTAAETISVMLAVFARVEPALRKSITFDNDTAFAQHALLRTMRAMTTWFCDAYASWQKGGVENANGRLRRWLPRQIDIDKVSDEEIQDIIITANLTPRKCLGFKTPFCVDCVVTRKSLHSCSDPENEIENRAQCPFSLRGMENPWGPIPCESASARNDASAALCIFSSFQLNGRVR
jgi:hypothetical protein